MEKDAALSPALEEGKGGASGTEAAATAAQAAARKAARRRARTEVEEKVAAKEARAKLTKTWQPRQTGGGGSALRRCPALFRRQVMSETAIVLLTTTL